MASNAENVSILWHHHVPSAFDCISCTRYATSIAQWSNLCKRNATKIDVNKFQTQVMNVNSEFCKRDIILNTINCTQLITQGNTSFKCHGPSACKLIVRYYGLFANNIWRRYHGYAMREVSMNSTSLHETNWFSIKGSSCLFSHHSRIYWFLFEETKWVFPTYW